VAILAQARSPVESHHPGSGRFDQFVDPFTQVGPATQSAQASAAFLWD